MRRAKLSDFVCLARAFVLWACCLLPSFGHAAGLVQEDPPVAITLQKIVHEAVQRNSSAINDYLQTKISREQVLAEEGAFDTVFQTSLQSKRMHTQNGVEDAINKKTADYTENADGLEVGFGGLLPGGTLWDMKFNQNKRGSSTIDLYANYKNEYDNALKLTLTQPLLKGFGSRSTMVKLNLAELQSEIDGQKFEQKLMELVGVTVQIYWKLYGAQQILLGWEKSMGIAEEALKDLELRAQAGKIPQTEYLENVSAVSIRRAELYNAKSKVDEAQNQLLTLLNTSVADTRNLRLVATDDPFVRRDVLLNAESYITASLNNWPEYRIARKKLEKEKVQLEYSENQALPQLDLFGSFGSTSLDSNYDRSFRNVTSGEFLNWSAGVKFSMPLDNLQANGNLNIARMKARQAEVELDAFVKSYGNSIHSKLSEVRSYQSQLRDYENGLRINAELLEIERQKLKSGRTNLKKLLDKQDDFVSYQRRVFSSVVNYKLAEAALDIAAGKILAKYDVDPKSLNYSDEVISGNAQPLFSERTQ